MTDTKWDVVDDAGTVLATVTAPDRTAAEWAATAVPGAHDAVGVGVRPHVEIPEDVRDNSETVTDYAFMRHRSPDRGVISTHMRDDNLRLYQDHFGATHTVYSWLDVNPDGQRCRFDMVINEETGSMVALYHTEYWTRVPCARGDWCPSYAAHYTVVVDSDGKKSDPVPYCDEHVNELRRNIADLPMTLHLSERLRIGQHD